MRCCLWLRRFPKAGWPPTGRSPAHWPGAERRLVGRVLAMSHWYGSYPCHRVVNHAGRLVPGWSEQEELLRREGVFLKENGCVDLALYQWRC